MTKYDGKLYWLTQLFTLICLALFGLDFALGGARPVGNNLVVVYLALLSAYAADKEVGRWTKRRGEAPPSRKGSWFVVAWTLFYLAAYTAEHFHAGAGWKVPEGLAKVVVSVVGVFFGSGISKRFHAMLRGEGEAWGGDEIRQAAAAARINDEEELRRAALLALLKASPEGLSGPELVRGSGMSKSAANRHLADLMKGGKAVAFGRARSTVYKLKS